MDKLFVLVFPELVKAIPVTLVAAVAAFSLWSQAKSLAKRFAAVETKVEAATVATANLPQAFERLKAAETELTHLRQEQHDANLMARQYVTRSELVESLGTTGQKLHARVDTVEQQVVRLDERSKRHERE
jgi:predicted  nucleic acid-binding Zn-ribbon protein